MCQYQLLSRHIYHDGTVLEAGTIVGDDQPIPWKYPNGDDMPPSNQMVGVDEDGKKAVADLQRELYGNVPDAGLSEVQQAARKTQADAQKALDEGSAPVSEQQAYERGEGDPPAKPGIQPGAPNPSKPGEAAPVTPHVTGQPSMPGIATPDAPQPRSGAATPKTEQKSEAARPRKPNEEMYPKG